MSRSARKKCRDLGKCIMTMFLQVRFHKTITTARLSHRVRMGEFLHSWPHTATANTIGTSSLVLTGTPTPSFIVKNSETPP